MAKKRAQKTPPPPGQLFETETPVSRKLKNQAARYKEASVKKAQATAHYNAQKEALIDMMKDERTGRVVIESEGVRKALVLVEAEKLTETAIKEPKGVEED